MIEEMDLFKTTDLNLASVLTSLDFSLEYLGKVSEQQFAFYFMHSESLDEVIQQYWSRTLRVEPQDAFAHQKMLKARIHHETNPLNS